MLLPPLDADLFFKLHQTLMFFVNQRLQVLPDDVASPDEFSSLPPQVCLEVRDAFLQHTDLIEPFVNENPARLSSDELDIVRSWRHLVHGKFYLFRQLKKYMVFLSANQPTFAYGVLALTQPFEELVGPYLPILTETVLLPFRGMIVYEGLLRSYNISFGSGIRRSLNESFKEAKARHGIVTSLPMSNEPLPTKVPQGKSQLKKKPKAESTDKLTTINDLIDQFCHEHLNEEYAELCHKMAEKLAHKRPSPLLHGKPETWASGIVRTIGWINFLHDKSQTLHMRLSDIEAHFGVSESSGAAKSAAIRKTLKIHHLDPNWTLPSRLEDNPLAWMLQVNGLMIDVRQAPREVQEIAFRKGLIPYIPADRQQGE